MTLISSFAAIAALVEIFVMPFSHDTYKYYIGQGMPEGLSGDEQHSWLMQHLVKIARHDNRVWSTLCGVVDFAIRESKFDTFDSLESVIYTVRTSKPGRKPIEYFEA